MFTVIIAEQEILDMFEEFRMFLNPLLNNKDIAFCPWNRNADTLDKMLPDIYDKVTFRKEWRAVIVNSDNINTLNPFDFTGYKDEIRLSGESDWSGIAERRQARFDCYKKAFDNPLTKLTSALCGTPVFNSVIEDKEIYQGILSGNLKLYEYMLDCQLKALNLTEKAAWADNYQRNNLTRFVEREDMDRLIDAIENGRTKDIVDMIPSDKIINFISLVGNADPFYSDPEYIECIVENTKKTEMFDALAQNFTFKDKKPCEVICVSPRTFDCSVHNDNSGWKDEDENDYSNFCEHNLYNDKLKFILFDLLSSDNKQYLFERIRMMCFLLILAGNNIPYGVVTPRRVYRAEFEFDSKAIEDTCTEYISKLKATSMLIKEQYDSAKTEIEEHLDRHTFTQLFESDVPISVDASEYSRNDLFAKGGYVGLAADCPRNEKAEWDNEYRAISKRFVKYLKEPRRAVKAAVNNDFRRNNRIDDDRALRMTASQTEDIEDRLSSEEQCMVESSTTRLFRNTKYKKDIEEAGREISESISQRMSKVKTILVSAVSILAFFIGFIPLAVRNTDNDKAILWAVGITLCSVLIFAIAGVFKLFALRKKHIRKYDSFNKKMSGICSEIEDGLNDFSTYLGHACNVMRASSVLQTKESKASVEQRVLNYHAIKVNEK
ncbi:MAG: hypothetical protein U0L11_11465, partial [Acutalibacteraceae bacterium]|nr:hypothetical protein [Acutalibacteraceae bacterium]